MKAKEIFEEKGVFEIPVLNNNGELIGALTNINEVLRINRVLEKLVKHKNEDYGVKGKKMYILNSVNQGIQNKICEFLRWAGIEVKIIEIKEITCQDIICSHEMLIMTEEEQRVFLNLFFPTLKNGRRPGYYVATDMLQFLRGNIEMKVYAEMATWLAEQNNNQVYMNIYSNNSYSEYSLKIGKKGHYTNGWKGFYKNREEQEELAECITTVVNHLGIPSHVDIQNKYVNVKNGIRRTTNHPIIYKNTSHKFGPSTIYEVFLADKDTIASNLQKIIYEKIAV